MSKALKRTATALVTVLFYVCVATPSQAHTMAPVLVTVTETSATEFQIVWSFSGDDTNVDPSSLSLSFSPRCTLDSPAIARKADKQWYREERHVCGHRYRETLELSVRGLEQVDTYVAVRVLYLDAGEQIYVLDEDSNSISLSQSNDGLDSWFQYLILGGQHILHGADHLLFVIALCLLAAGAIRPLIGLITAFTVAHSITLSAAALGWVHLPARPVEALIALSVALVAVDLFKNERFSNSRIIDYWPLVFIFGLLHGLGFAGSLMEFGLPQNALLAGLLAFNLGVEFAQIVLVFACVVLIQIAARLGRVDWLSRAIGLVIGCTAGYWFVSRVA